MYLDKDFAYEPARFVVTVAKLVWVDSKPALVAENRSVAVVIEK